MMSHSRQAPARGPSQAEERRRSGAIGVAPIGVYQLLELRVFA